MPSLMTKQHHRARLLHRTEALAACGLTEAFCEAMSLAERRLKNWGLGGRHKVPMEGQQNGKGGNSLGQEGQRKDPGELWQVERDLRFSLHLWQVGPLQTKVKA